MQFGCFVQLEGLRGKHEGLVHISQVDIHVVYVMLGCVVLDCIGLGWLLDCVGLCCVVLGWVGLYCVGLYCVGLGSSLQHSCYRSSFHVESLG